MGTPRARIMLGHAVGLIRGGMDQTEAVSQAVSAWGPVLYGNVRRRDELVIRTLDQVRAELEARAKRDAAPAPPPVTGIGPVRTWTLRPPPGDQGATTGIQSPVVARVMAAGFTSVSSRVQKVPTPRPLPLPPGVHGQVAGVLFTTAHELRPLDVALAEADAGGITLDLALWAYASRWMRKRAEERERAESRRLGQQWSVRLARIQARS